MKHNALAGTDLKLSEISFGAGSAAGLMINGNRAEQLEAVRAAIEAGINHFDTAPQYGFGSSEVNLGAVLQELRADVLVTSKFNIPSQFLKLGEIGARIRQSVRESLVRLRRDHIDILLIHNATHFRRNLGAQLNPAMPVDLLPHVSLDDLLGPGGVWETVEELKRAGLVRHFGVSGQDNDPMAVRALIGAGRIAIFNQPFNLLNPTAGFPAARRNRMFPEELAREQADYIDFGNVMEFARVNGVGASIISPVAAGALTDEALRGDTPPEVARRGPRFPRAGQYERELALARRFLPVAKAAGMGVTELAYRFALSAPGAVTVVGGFSSSVQMHQAVRAAERGPLGLDVLDAIYTAWFGENRA
jgi:L-glyceraldehyde 3-phosphate reductase